MRKKKRRFRHLLHKHLIWLHTKPKSAFSNGITFLEKQSDLTYHMMSILSICKECIEFYKLAEDFDLTDEVIEVIISKYYITHQLDKTYLSKNKFKQNNDILIDAF